MMVLAACSTDPDPGGGGGEGGAAPLVTFTYAVTLFGHGAIDIADQHFSCEKESCSTSIELTTANFGGTHVSGTPEEPTWVLTTMAVDGADVPQQANWGSFDLSIPGDHAVELGFEELPPCTPTAERPGPPMLPWGVPEMCPGRVAHIDGVELANASASPDGLGICFYLRNAVVGESATPDTVDPRLITTSSNNYGLDLFIPEGYPPGPALVVDRTLQGRAMRGTTIVSNLPTPVIQSVSPNPAQEGDTITITGQDLDHVNTLTFWCETNCTSGLETDVSVISRSIAVLSPTTIEYSIGSGLFKPGQTFGLQLSNACVDSELAPFAYQ